MPDESITTPSPDAPERLREVAALFLRMGTTAFGGPAAHIAMMQDEMVERRKWVTAREFLDMLAATNFIPGPNSTEMAIHLGYRRAGWKGLVTAGCCFIFPAALMCAIIAALYVRYGQFPITQSMLYGVKPVVIAVVVQALYKLGRMAVKTAVLALVTALAIVALLLGVNELVTLFGAGMLMVLLKVTGGRGLTPLPMLALPIGLMGGSATVPATMAAVGGAPLLPLFLVFLKIGSVLFGSGYVLLAFLKADIVDRGWLSDTQLLDAIAVGQVTPGPVFTTATFVGYVAAGPMGALLATLGIFLPAFIFVAISAPLLPMLRNSKAAGAFLDGLNVASLALMAVVTFQLTRTAVVDPLTAALAVVSLVFLFWKNVNSAWIVLGGAAVGIVRVWLVPV